MHVCFSIIPEQVIGESAHLIGKRFPVFFRGQNFCNDVLCLLEKTDPVLKGCAQGLEVHAAQFPGKLKGGTEGPAGLLFLEEKRSDMPAVLNNIDLEVLCLFDDPGCGLHFKKSFLQPFPRKFPPFMQQACPVFS